MTSRIPPGRRTHRCTSSYRITRARRPQRALKEYIVHEVIRHIGPVTLRIDAVYDSIDDTWIGWRLEMGCESLGKTLRTYDRALTCGDGVLLDAYREAEQWLLE